MNKQELLDALESTGLATPALRERIERLDQQILRDSDDRARGWAQRHPETALGLAVVLLDGARDGLAEDGARWHGAAHACDHVEFALRHLETDDRQENTGG
jgi:hypothetical protein